MATTNYGEGAVYPHTYDSGSGTWIPDVAESLTSEGLKEVLCYGEDSTPSRKRLRTNTAGELIVQTSINSSSVVSLPRETIDAFGRYRVSENFTVFNSKQIYDNQPVLWDTELTGTGNAVWSGGEASTVLSVSAPGDAAVRQTYRKFNYQPGKSQLIFLTGIIRNAGTFDAGITSRCGNFGTTAGLYFEYDETAGLGVSVRKNGSDTIIPQASWNLDPFDGTGPSGVTIDVTKSQIFVINFEWLAVGSVWYGFVVNGALHWAHREDHANIIGGVYMQTPNNPVRFEIVSTTGTTGSMTQICCSVISEGGTDPSGNTFATALTTEIALNTTNANPEQVLMALTYKDFTASQIEVDLVDVSTVANSSNDVYALLVRLVRDPATQLRNAADTGPPTLTYSAIKDSALQVARPAAAYVVTDDFLGNSGYILDMFVVQSRNTSTADVKSTIKLGWSLAGASDILVVSAFPYDNTTVTASFSWTEL